MWQNMVGDTKRFVKTVAKGTLLVGWIALLGIGALAAVNGRASKTVLNYFSSLQLNVKLSAIPDSPSSELRAFLEGAENPPPIAGLLAVCLPKWAGTKVQREDYLFLFQRASDRLWACVNDRQFDVATGKISPDFIPIAFHDGTNLLPSEPVLLTPELKTWIENQKQAALNTASRTSLVDTFVLLIIIGAFGSLIFLTRDFMVDDQTTRFTAYLFRPVLGVFLAVAMFVVVITANAAVSTSDILQVRRETLYILALAAGLLSDKAYSIIDERARGALAKLKEEKGTGNSPAVGKAPPGIETAIGDGQRSG